MADSTDDLGIPMKPARPVGPAAGVTPVGRAAGAVPPRVPEMARAAAEPARAPEPPARRVTEPLGVPANATVAAPAPPPAAAVSSPTPRRAEGEPRRLAVGREISLSGEISSCDTLIIEGTVEANLQNCRDVDIAESGLFKGTASIDNADVRGSFEGHLTVRKRLLIRAGGQVSGTIRYGQIEIELGGRITGDVQASGDAEIIAELPNARAAF
jgi:cytoskeletal protein CcmA (bactofilin family)